MMNSGLKSKKKCKHFREAAVFESFFHNSLILVTWGNCVPNQNIIYCTLLFIFSSMCDDGNKCRFKYTMARKKGLPECVLPKAI